jgi:phosphate/sulfate permease
MSMKIVTQTRDFCLATFILWFVQPFCAGALTGAMLFMLRRKTSLEANR